MVWLSSRERAGFPKASKACVWYPIMAPSNFVFIVSLLSWRKAGGGGWGLPLKASQLA